MRFIRQILLSIAVVTIFIVVAATDGARAHEIAIAVFHDDNVTIGSSMSCETDRRNCNTTTDRHSIPCHSSAAGHCISVLMGLETQNVTNRAASQLQRTFGDTDMLNGLIHIMESPPPRV